MRSLIPIHSDDNTEKKREGKFQHRDMNEIEHTEMRRAKIFFPITFLM